MERMTFWLPKLVSAGAFLWYALHLGGASGPSSAVVLVEVTTELAPGGSNQGAAYTVLGRLAAFIPLGDIALRLTLLSALCASLAAGGVSRLLLGLGSGGVGALCGAAVAGIALAAALPFAHSATMVGATTVMALWFVGVLLLTERVANGAPARVGLTLAWLWGFGFGIDATRAWIPLLPVGILLFLRLYRGARWPLLAPMVAFGGALFVQLFVPVRDVALQTAGTSTAFGERFFLHFFDAGYYQSAAAVSPSFWVSYVERLTDELGVLCLLAAIGGIWPVLQMRRGRWLAVTLLVGVLVDAPNCGVLPLIAVCTLAGIGVGVLAARMGAAEPFVGVCIALVVLVGPLLVASRMDGAGATLPCSQSRSKAPALAPTDIQLGNTIYGACRASTTEPTTTLTDCTKKS